MVRTTRRNKALFQKMLKLIIYETKGTGSASLPFEVILEKAQQAEFWIALVIFFFKTNERQ
jgi:hypothetical protein